MNVPKIRFSEFTDEWDYVSLNTFVERVKTKNINNESNLVLTISAQYGLVDQREFFNRNVSSSNLTGYYLLNNGDFAYNKSYSNGYPWGAIKRLNKYDMGVVSSLYICFNCKNNINPLFLEQYFETNKWYQQISEVSVEGARNHGLLNISVEDFFNTEHYIPTIDEQNKIGQFLTLLDKKIELQSKKIEALELYKLCIRKRLFDELNEYDTMKIKDVLNFEQPTKYIVNSTEYLEDSKLIPVLTANKAFILGYCDEKNTYNKGESIIFDDFTMDMKYVNFEYKIKSSAIKILTSKSNFNLKYIFELLDSMKLYSEDHKRHYISFVQELCVKVPNISVQDKIADELNLINKKIQLNTKLLTNIQTLKKGLMQNMFI